jgi:hypothetical protein
VRGNGQDGIEREILDVTQALYYALQDAADVLHECASECGDCDGEGVRLDGGVCAACAPTREAEQRARASQGLVPKIEQLGQQAEDSYKRSVAAASHESERLRAERDLALGACLALRARYYPYGPASEGSGRIYTMACHAIYKIERGEVELPAKSNAALTQELTERADKSHEAAGLISQTDLQGRSVPGANGSAARPGDRDSRSPASVDGAPATPYLDGATVRGRSGLEAPPLLETLDRLDLEMIHFRSRGRGIQFLINALLETLEQAQGAAVRQASVEVSRTEMIERLRSCRDSFMRPGGEPLYSPAEIAVAVDAAIGGLPADLPSLPRTVDLVRELELAVNEFEAFGLTTEAQGHRRFLHRIRDDGYLADPTGMSATESSGSTSLASEDTLGGAALDSDASP